MIPYWLLFFSSNYPPHSHSIVICLSAKMSAGKNCVRDHARLTPFSAFFRFHFRKPRIKTTNVPKRIGIDHKMNQGSKKASQQDLQHLLETEGTFRGKNKEREHLRVTEKGRIPSGKGSIQGSTERQQKYSSGKIGPLGSLCIRKSARGIT